MAITEEECHDLVHASRQTGCHLTVGFNRRFAPYLRHAKTAVGTGRRLLNIRVSVGNVTTFSAPAFTPAINTGDLLCAIIRYAGTAPTTVGDNINGSNAWTFLGNLNGVGLAYFQNSGAAFKRRNTGFFAPADA